MYSLRFEVVVYKYAVVNPDFVRVDFGWQKVFDGEKEYWTALTVFSDVVHHFKTLQLLEVFVVAQTEDIVLLCPVEVKGDLLKGEVKLPLKALQKPTVDVVPQVVKQWFILDGPGNKVFELDEFIQLVVRVFMLPVVHVQFVSHVHKLLLLLPVLLKRPGYNLR